jgi:hypothetical protein
MRLRSLTKHIREQNWFAVALDFFIVVAGILIAFQITNWNEASKTAAREAVILEQLHSEFSSTLDGMEQAKQENEEGLSAIREVLSAIQDGVKPEDDAAFIQKIRRAGGLNTGPAEPTTLVELLSSGSLSELSSPELRQALTRHHANVDEFQAYADIVLLRVSAPEGGYHKAVYVNPDHPNGDMVIKYDWDSLLTAREQFQVFYYGKLSLSRYFDKLVESIEDVLSQLENELQ